MNRRIAEKEIRKKNNILSRIEVLSKDMEGALQRIAQNQVNISNKVDNALDDLRRIRKIKGLEKVNLINNPDGVQNVGELIQKGLIATENLVTMKEDEAKEYFDEHMILIGKKEFPFLPEDVQLIVERDEVIFDITDGKCKVIGRVVAVSEIESKEEIRQKLMG